MDEFKFQAHINLFDAATKSYRGENSLLLAECAKLAYFPEQVIKTSLAEQLQITNFSFYDSKGTQGFIAANEQIIIVAFRGTEKKIRDFLADAEFIPTKVPEGKVHEGFLKGLKRVWEVPSDSGSTMPEQIAEYRNNNQSVWFCGHSLGGALAILAAEDYAEKNPDALHGIYTIGQPRVGNKSFIQHLDKLLGNRYFRLINNNDIVPRVPPAGLILKYRHSGNLVYFDSEGKLFESMPWWKRAWEFISSFRINGLGETALDTLADHSSDDYVELAQKNRSVTTKWS